MHAYGPELLEPVFHFLDGLIEEHGHILYMGLVYISIPLIAWILSGGLRQKSKGRAAPDASSPVVFIHLPGRPPKPPEELDPFPPPREPSWPEPDGHHWD